MKPCRVIVWEPLYQWTVPLRRLLAGDEVRIWQCRTQRDCDELLAQSPASVVGVTVSLEQLGARLEWLSNVSRRFPRARLVVFASPLLRDAETTIRESGAVEVIYRPTDLKPVAEIVRRHIARVPETKMTYSNRILASLPWGG